MGFWIPLPSGSCRQLRPTPVEPATGPPATSGQTAPAHLKKPLPSTPRRCPLREAVRASPRACVAPVLRTLTASPSGQTFPRRPPPETQSNQLMFHGPGRKIAPKTCDTTGSDPGERQRGRHCRPHRVPEDPAGGTQARGRRTDPVYGRGPDRDRVEGQPADVRTARVHRRVPGLEPGARLRHGRARSRPPRLAPEGRAEALQPVAAREGRGPTGPRRGRLAPAEAAGPGQDPGAQGPGTATQKPLPDDRVPPVRRRHEAGDYLPRRGPLLGFGRDRDGRCGGPDAGQGSRDAGRGRAALDR